LPCDVGQCPYGILLGLLDDIKKPEKPNRPDQPEALRLKIPCLDHIFKAVDIEPVACRVEHTDWVLPFQQFLE
jgi:hypothetical protein